jgi:hypothetical protein
VRRAALVVLVMSAGTDMDTARVPHHILAGALGVVARLDAHMEVNEEEEVVVVVVRTASGCMKTWGSGGSAQGGLATQDTLNGLSRGCRCFLMYRDM